MKCVRFDRIFWVGQLSVALTRRSFRISQIVTHGSFLFTFSPLSPFLWTCVSMEWAKLSTVKKIKYNNIGRQFKQIYQAKNAYISSQIAQIKQNSTKHRSNNPFVNKNLHLDLDVKNQ